jgi:hypothetical protein
LVSSSKGLFLVQSVNGEAVVYPLGNQPSGRMWNLPGGGGVLIDTYRGMLAVAVGQASGADCVAP